MSAAESIVIANSTLAGGLLGFPIGLSRVSFAPRKWFHPGTLNDRYLACPGWTLLDDPAAQSAAA